MLLGGIFLFNERIWASDKHGCAGELQKRSLNRPSLGRSLKNTQQTTSIIVIARLKRRWCPFGREESYFNYNFFIEIIPCFGWKLFKVLKVLNSPVGNDDDTHQSLE